MAKKDYAPGLPNKTNYGDLSKLSPKEIVTLLIQEHNAKRAGKHYDVRIGSPETDLLSWATKKSLPKPGEPPIALYPQPLHRWSYKDFEGNISEGYGAGVVKKFLESKILIRDVKPDSITFSTAEERYPTRYALIKPKTYKNWLLLNTTPTEKVPYDKIHFNSVEPQDAEKVIAALDPNSTVTAKLDGAAILGQLSNKGIELTSYRTSKVTGNPIIHTERVFGGESPKTEIPKKYQNSILRGELYGAKGKKAIPAHSLGGLLNSSISKSLANQKERGIDLKTMLFDINRLKNKSTAEMPYSERKEILKDIIKYLPNDKFHLPEEAKTPEEAMKLYKAIQSGSYPLTSEGVVIHHEEPGKKPTKVKFTDEHDVHITGFFEGEGRLAKKGVGGFTYSVKPGGPTVGKVGTGFSDELRKDMMANPNDYLGRVAKIRSQGQHESQAFRAPSLISLHEDY